MATEIPQFTGGPWFVTERGGYYEILGQRSNASWHGQKDTWAVGYADTDREEPEQEANARLMAAAPDLYAALAALIGDLGPGGYLLPGGAVKTAKARATLAKARGETL